TMSDATSTAQADLPSQQSPKRPRNETPTLVSIDDINNYKFGEIFEGDIMAAYKTVLDKQRGKELLRVDLTDKKGELTITVNIMAPFIKTHEPSIIPQKAIRITNFTIAPKSDYDHCDCDFILQITKNTTIQSIDCIFPHHMFIPNSSIHQLLSTTDHYATATIAAICTSCQQIGNQFIIDITDGNSPNDKARVYIFQTLAADFHIIENKIRRKEPAIYLFKNLAKRSESIDKSLRSTQSTFVTSVKAKRSLERLQLLLTTTMKVEGTLTVAKAYSSPFEPICGKCNLTIERLPPVHTDIAYCSNCEQECPYAYCHRLLCSIKSADKTTIQCIAKNKLLTELLPSLTAIAYPQYIEDKEAVIEQLSHFTLHGIFTIDKENIIRHMTTTPDENPKLKLHFLHRNISDNQICNSIH
ncbi:hypothetical protein KI387_000342, partial [Taxus chinensis]